MKKCCYPFRFLIIKTNEMHYFSNLFWYRTLHVSDRFTVHHRESSTVYTAIGILIYIQQDATLHSLFISENCSTCFGWYFHPSSGAHTTVSTASGICHTVTAICRYRGSRGTGLSLQWVAYATCFG